MTKQTKLKKVKMTDTETRQRRHTWTDIVMMNRRDIRILFGITFADQWGHFTDQWMSPIIHSYLDWPLYPKGNHVLEGHSEAIYSAAMSDDGFSLFTSSVDRSITAWNLITHEIIHQWQASDHYEIWCLAYSSDLLCSADWDGLIKIWDCHSFTLVRTLKGHMEGVVFVEFNPKGDTLVSCACDNTVRLWRVQTGECVRVLEGHSDDIFAVHFIDEIILSGSRDHSLRVWDLSGKTKEECTVITKGIPEVIGLCVNCDSSMIECMDGNRIWVFQWPTMDIVCEIQAPTNVGCFHPSNPNVLAVGYLAHNSVCVFDVRYGRMIRTLGKHRNAVRTLCFTPDGSRLVSVSDDKTIILWDISDWIIE